MISRLAFIVSLTALGAVGAQPPMPMPRQADTVERHTVTIDLTARYVGILSGSADGIGFEALITADLIQAGNRIIGSWFTSASASGTVTGTVMGSSTLIFEVRSTRPCANVLRGSGVIEDSGAVLHGSYGGAGCAGWITASFRVKRELYVGAGAQWAASMLPK